MTRRFDMGVIGSGFGGALMALIARRLGYRVVLIERTSHPRFALGESSTPLGDLILDRLAKKFTLEGVSDLSSYGAWKRRHPTLSCGLKRGFTFFRHEAGQAFRAGDPDHHEFLVGANPSVELADTHWLRADVDQYLVGEAVRAGVDYYDETHLDIRRLNGTWLCELNRRGVTTRIEADLLVDATGESSVVSRVSGAQDSTASLRTHSRLLYAHVRDLRPTKDVLFRGVGTDHHPYDADAAAVHHVFKGGWLYVLRFDHGVASVGFCLHPEVFPDIGLSPAAEVTSILEHFPSLHELFEGASEVVPWTRTPRVQFLRSEASGDGWIALPAAAGRIDALYSTGIAHTLLQVERIAHLLETRPPREVKALEWSALGRQVIDELRWIDEIVAASYRHFGHFESFIRTAAVYFLASIVVEETRRKDNRAPISFLLALDPEFRAKVRSVWAELDRPSGLATLDESMRQHLGAYDLAHLLAPGRRTMWPWEPIASGAPQNFSVSPSPKNGAGSTE